MNTASRTSSVSRRSFMGLTGVALAGGLASCATGSGPDAAATPLAPASSAKGSIRILDDNTNKLFQASTIASFEKDTGIKVKYEQANFNDLHDKLATLFSAQDSSYDVVMTWAAWSAEFGQAGWLQPLDKKAIPAGLIPAALDAVSWDGTVYGLPKFASAQTMYWNKAHFSAAGLDPETTPATWDDFVSAAKALTTPEHFGFAADMGNTDGAYQNFLKVLLLNGGAMYDGDNKPTFADEKGVDALSRLKDLLDTKVMSPATLQLTNASDLNTVFANGQASIVFNWPAQYAAAVTDGPLDAAGVGIGVLPGITVPTASIDGSEGFSINSFSKNKDAALTWLQYVTQDKTQKQMVKTEGWLPVTEKQLADPELVKAQPVVPVYAEAAKGPIKRYGSPWYSDVTQVLSDSITGAMLGKSSPADALKEASTKAADIVKRYQKG